MTRIETHKQLQPRSAEDIRTRLCESKQVTIRGFQIDPHNMLDAVTGDLMYIVQSHYAGDDVLAREWLQFSNDVSVIAFRAVIEKAPFTVTLCGEEIEVAAGRYPDPIYYCGPVNHLARIPLAAALRDHDALALYASNRDLVYQGSSTFVHCWAEAVSLFAAGDASWPKMAQHTREGLTLPHHCEGHVVACIGPMIAGMEALTAGDAAGLNSALEAALLAFKRSVSRGKPSKDDTHFIAWQPALLAIWAVDRGMELTVESPYLPDFLIKGTP